MWKKDDPNHKMFSLALYIVLGLLIFTAGVYVGKFKMLKAFTLKGNMNYTQSFGHKGMMFNKMGGHGYLDRKDFMTQKMMKLEKDKIMKVDLGEAADPAPETAN